VALALLLAHEPPDTVLVSVVLYPLHTFLIPLIAPGNGTTVSVLNDLQPVGIVYVIIAVP
jgi:hypothetical protein